MRFNIEELVRVTLRCYTPRLMDELSACPLIEAATKEIIRRWHWKYLKVPSFCAGNDYVVIVLLEQSFKEWIESLRNG